jgi:hypothetical protein
VLFDFDDVRRTVYHYFRLFPSFFLFLLDSSVMLLKDFYIRVASSEQTCTTFLLEHQLLKDVNNINPCHKCGTEMCEKRRKNRNGEFVPIFRCPKKGCQTSRSVRQGNAIIKND